jgi:ssDNA-binding Zn-finger/Zn-ribbon topoisomerase 1
MAVEDMESLVRCPLCKSLLYPRQARGVLFLGCSTYPKCRGTRSIKPENWDAIVDFVRRKRIQAEDDHKKPDDDSGE